MNFTGLDRPRLTALGRWFPVILIAAVLQFGCETAPPSTEPVAAPETAPSADRLFAEAATADPVRAAALYLEAGFAYLDPTDAAPDIARAKAPGE